MTKGKRTFEATTPGLFDLTLFTTDTQDTGKLNEIGARENGKHKGRKTPRTSHVTAEQISDMAKQKGVPGMPATRSWTADYDGK